MFSSIYLSYQETDMVSFKLILISTIFFIIIAVPIYFFLKKKNLERKLKEGREVTEKEKIRVYLNNINEKFRSKYK